MLIVNNPKAQKLYHELQGFTFNEAGVEFSFLDRLADENAWTHKYAAAVLEEYRRFLVLSVCSGHAVTPSDEVDQVWHLHLLYTESYWRKLCGQVLGRELHHIPTEGGAKEEAKFMERYARTRDSYEKLFGEAPPRKIWPEPKSRFSRKQHFQRIDVNKKSLRLLAGIGIVVAGIIYFSVLTPRYGLGVGLMASVFLCGFLFGGFMFSDFFRNEADFSANGGGGNGGCSGGGSGA